MYFTLFSDIFDLYSKICFHINTEKIQNKKDLRNIFKRLTKGYSKRIMNLVLAIKVGILLLTCFLAQPLIKYYAADLWYNQQQEFQSFGYHY
ncbi:unnamed protein product (macronuclear) [Paramecium tetraurelia]|uniref:Uncharacterized protein n=1 Tax=Paramecium tetraurelia TaxID=5888 RepID=A0CB92_PARTE|nr:uncharacterized protein GSPATT00036842001 [Paramecium tetraurelia]CAK68059.1 unnamed protein product [Paramecium tetraurelia]|eukprot:XP_001435456.1 hypothetical protein (macronuclear) [Paramecium tetraurelia strain d4-2]